MRRLLVAVMLLAGCRKSTLATPKPTASAAPVPAQPADPVVDLLHTVDCTVAVSSKVENPHDFPEHLVDGKQETAWSGRTGDLNGWIAFRVPRSARVSRVELAAGFDKQGPKGDLFTMNHRISRVRLSRESAVVKEVDLDPNVRTPQAIDLDEPGGDFKLEVLSTLPGSEKQWRELTVSELRVYGRAGGAPENPSHLPRMAIGSLDGVRPQATPAAKEPVSAGPYASIAEMCKAYDRVMTPIIDRAFPGDRYPGKIAGPHCQVWNTGDAAKKLALFAQGPVKSASIVVFDDAEEVRARLVLETAAGFSRTNVQIWSRYHDDPGCGHGSNHDVEDAKLEKTSTGQDVLVVRVIDIDVHWMQPDPSTSGRFTVERAHACRVDDKGGIGCEGPVVLGSAHDGWDDEPWAKQNYVIDPAKTPWTSRKVAVLGPAGDLRAGGP